MEVSLIVSCLIGLVAGLGLAVPIARRGRYRPGALLDAVGKPALRWTASGLTANGKARAIFGLAETLDGPGPLADALELDDREDAVRALEDARRGGAGAVLSLPAKKGGSLIEVEVAPFEDGCLLLLRDDSAGARLKAKNAVLDAVLNVLPVAVWWRDGKSMKVAGGNRAYAGLLGLEDTAAIPGSKRHITETLLGEGGRSLTQRAIATPGPHSESHHVVVDGKRRLFDFTEIALEDRTAVAGYAEDRTALEDVQTTLADHIDAQSEILEGMLTAIAIFGPDRRLNFCNSAYRRMWQLDQDWLEREPLLDEIVDRLHEERRFPEMVDLRALKRDQNALFRTISEPIDEVLYLPDERTIRQLIAPYPLGGLLFIFEDVTDRLALERSVNTLTKVQQATLNNLYEGVVVYAQDGRIRLYNRAFVEIWGLEDADLAGSPHVTEVFDKVRQNFTGIEDWDAFRRDRVLSIVERKPESGRLSLSGRRKIDYANVLLPDGQVLVLYLDVTDSINVQLALQERNAALENADLLKAQFISNMSYDLRTPLNAIIGFTDVLQTGIAGDLNAKQAEYVDHVLKASRTLAGLVSDLLDLATIQAGFMDLTLSEADLTALTSDLADDMVTVATEAGVSVAFVPPATTPPLIECDPKRVEQALRKLIETAIKFTPPGGAVELGVSTVAAEDGSPEAVQVMITDSGGGVSSVERVRSFGSFVNAASADTRQSGTGLGLALSKSLTELHGGSIELRDDTADAVSVVSIWPVKVPESRQAPFDL